MSNNYGFDPCAAAFAEPTYCCKYFRGATGPMGPQGSAGPAGAQGATGDAGPQGQPGPQGMQGVPGESASIEILRTITGEPGSNAAVLNSSTKSYDAALTFVIPAGLPGACGPTGAKGGCGCTGPTGATGATGAAGPAGPRGAEGPAGPQSTSIQGQRGATGATGTQGIPGMRGATGPTGMTGSPGVRGATGAQGAQGARGATGATGATGSKGAQGVHGAVGATGATGAAGTPGVRGATGAKGAKGDQGLPGPRGVAGATGPKGDSGTAYGGLFNTDCGEFCVRPEEIAALTFSGTFPAADTHYDGNHSIVLERGGVYEIQYALHAVSSSQSKLHMAVTHDGVVIPCSCSCKETAAHGSVDIFCTAVTEAQAGVHLHLIAYGEDCGCDCFMLDEGVNLMLYVKRLSGLPVRDA